MYVSQSDLDAILKDFHVEKQKSSFLKQLKNVPDG